MAFGFLKAPFKLIGGAAKGAFKAVKFVARRVPRTAAGFLAGGPAGAGVAFATSVVGGGGGDPSQFAEPPPDFNRFGPFQQTLPRSTSRFSLGNTVATWVERNLPEVAAAGREVLDLARGETRTQARRGVTPLIIGAAVGIPLLTFAVVSLAAPRR